MEGLKIEYLPIDSLKPYDKNARKHNKKDIAAIVASIKEFGFLDPVGVWSDQNLIVEGHGRVQAAKQMGMTEVPCIRLDDLTDEQRRAYTLAHNKVAEMSGWIKDILDIELKDITDIDMERFGFRTATEVRTNVDDIVDDYEPGEIQFAEFIDETSQYIVLKFNHEHDWNNALAVFKLKKVKTYSTAVSGHENGMQSVGLGRVIDGVKAIKMIEQNVRELGLDAD